MSHEYLSTAAVEHAKAQTALQEARDAEWNNPQDIDAQRCVNYWERECSELSALDPETVIPLF